MACNGRDYLWVKFLHNYGGRTKKRDGGSYFLSAKITPFCRVFLGHVPWARALRALAHIATLLLIRSSERLDNTYNNHVHIHTQQENRVARYQGTQLV